MSLAQTLQKVQEDIRAGDLGKARSRLHGLIASYPDNLDLREQLGEVYWRLQLPEMAGRYWYLVEDKDERMQAACKRFEDEFRNDPYHMLFALKFKGGTEPIKGTYAGRVLDDLERRASDTYPWYPDLRKRGLSKDRGPVKESRTSKNRNFFFRLGCFILIVTAISLALIGLFTTISTVVKWLQ